MASVRISALGAVLAITCRWAAVAHPLCFYNDRPTDYEEELTFCPKSFQDDGACCTDAEEAKIEALYNAAAPKPLTGDCADLYKQVVCGPCHSYSAHLYERIGGELGGNDGMTMKGDFCDDLVAACAGQITFPTYGGASYCAKHVGGDGDQFWSYPYISTQSSGGDLEPVFDESMYGNGNLPVDLICMHMTPDGKEWWVGGQSGMLKSVALSNMGKGTTIMDISNLDNFYLAFEEGFLDFTFSPVFDSNKRFYVSYTAVKNSDPVNTLSRFDYVAGNTGSTLGSEEILLQSSKRSTSIHAGGWVDFKPSDAGKNVGSHDIYWSAGDSGPQTDPEKHGQNVNNLHSTIARISVPSTGTGYSIPAGNLNKGLPEICAYGLRNPFRCGFDSQTDDLYCGDVGHTYVEAIYKIECGKNYGWGRFEGSRCQEAVEDLYETPCEGVDRSPYEFPIYEYCHPSYYSDKASEDPFTGGVDICGERKIVGNGAIGGYVYRGDYYSDVLGGAYVFGDTGPQNNLYYLKQVGGEWVQGTIIGDGSVEVISFAEDKNREMYVITRENQGGGVHNWRVYFLPCGDLCFSTCLPQGEEQDFTRIGCYSNPANDRVLTLTDETPCKEKQQAMSPAVCASYCSTVAGAKYFGLEFSYQCWCGDASADYDKHGSLPDKSCISPCTSFPAETCGGLGAIEVYSLDGSTVITPPTPPTPTPEPMDGFVFEGCFADFQADRLLSNLIEDDDVGMTTQVCAELCVGSTYFGTEYGIQCFCSVDGDELDTGAGMCNYDCGGDAGQKCGGSGAITVYSYADGPGPTPVEETPAPAVPTPTGTHSFVGCYKDSPSARVLPVLIADSVTDLTTEGCGVLCADYTYFGTEYGDQCFCGNDAPDADEGVCTFACSGDGSQTCGGDNAVSVYTAGDSPGPTPSTDTPAPVVPKGTTAPVEPIAPTGPHSFVGCYVDSPSARALPELVEDSSATMTTEVCAALCASYTYFGTEYGVQCFCGDAEPDVAEGICNFECGGDDTEICGGFDAISVYTIGDTTVTPPSEDTPAPVVPQTTPAPAVPLPTGPYSFVGCYTDSRTARVLSDIVEDSSTTMTTKACAGLCAGYTYFGTEYGVQCFCGDAAPDAKEGECSFKCSGDESETCGGDDAISVYTFGDTLTSSTTVKTLAPVAPEETPAPVAPEGTPAPVGPKETLMPIAVEPLVPIPTGDFIPKGCFKDSPTSRVLSGTVTEDAEGMKPSVCAALCEGSTYFGLEYAVQCFCGSASDSLDADEGNCSLNCPGDDSFKCGGYDAISVYEFS